MKKKIIIALLALGLVVPNTVSAAKSDIKDWYFDVNGISGKNTPRSLKYYKGTNKRDKSAFVLNTKESPQKFRLTNQMFGFKKKGVVTGNKDSYKAVSNVKTATAKARSLGSNNGSIGYNHFLNMRRENNWDSTAYASGTWSADNKQGK